MSHPYNDNSAARTFRAQFMRAVERRRPLIGGGDTTAIRVFSGLSDGMDGVYVDVYGSGAVLIVYEGVAPRAYNATAETATVLEELKFLGVRAVYLKPFAKDRSRLGELPACVTDPRPAAGEILPEAIQIREVDWNLEIRIYDGLSTGLFLDQRENRRWVRDWVRGRMRSSSAPFRSGTRGGNTEEKDLAWTPGLNGGKGAEGAAPAVLNTFAYTCAFSIAAASGGAITTSVDVSARYLEWGKRNFAHNGMDASQHRFAKMDTFEFFGYANRKGLRYDLIILDPPSFASGSKKKGIRPWSSVNDYARLIREAGRLLNPKGVIFASTNTQELCRPGRLEREIIKGLGREPKWIKLPAPPIDFAKEHDQFAARAFSL